MKTLRVLPAAALFILLGVSAAFGYQAALKAGVSKKEVAKGETFTYTLSITEEGEADRPVRLKPLEFGVFRVSGTFTSSTVKAVDGKARRVTEQVYRLSTDVPGAHVIPPAVLELADPATGATQEMTSNEVTVTVSEEGRGVIQGLEDDIRDIKEPKTFLDRVKLYFYGLMALALLALLILSGFAFYVVSKRKKAAPPMPAAPGLSPREEALREIAAALSFRSDTARFYIMITDAIRRYISTVHGIQAMEATTSEILERAGSRGLPSGSVQRLAAVFTEADLVKFAKHRPDEAEKGRFAEDARMLVEEL